jgi:hypothetical protein
MKKICLLFIVSIFSGIMLMSQLQFGVRAGLTSASYTSSDFVQGTNYIVKKSETAEYGYHFGVIGQLEILGFFFQPELLISSIGNSYSITGVVANAQTVTKTDRSYNLDFPLILGYKLGPAKFEIGPTGRIMLANTSELYDYTGYQSKFNTASWALQTGVGLELIGLTVDLKYEIGLSKYGKGIEIAGVTKNFDSRVSQWVLSVGYFF